MKWSSRYVLRFVRSSAGATTVEYGLLVGLLSLVAIVAIAGLREIYSEAFVRVVLELAKGGVTGG